MTQNQRASIRWTVVLVGCMNVAVLSQEIGQMIIGAFGALVSGYGATHFDRKATEEESKREN